MKSFLSTRIKMVARNPVSSNTVTQELMMENQWICMSSKDVCGCQHDSQGGNK